MRLIRLLKYDLAAEVLDWMKAGIVTDEQGGEILARYGTCASGSRKRLDGWYFLYALGAVLSGLAVILVMSHNWEDIPRFFRLIVLCGGTFSCHLAGAHFWSRNEEHTARAWLILGSFLYGASIFLIAQIYHLGIHFPDGLLYWIAGTIPIAWLCRSLSLMILSSILAGIWMYLQFSLGHFPVMYLGLLGIPFAYCLKNRSLVLFLLNTIGLGMFIEFGVAHWKAGTHDYYQSIAFGCEHFYLTVGIQLLFCSIGVLLERLFPESDVGDYGMALRLWCMRFAVITLFVFSFEWPWREVLHDSRQSTEFLLWLGGAAVLSVLGMCGAAGIIEALRGAPVREKVPSFVPVVVGLSAFLLVLFLVFNFVEGSGMTTSDSFRRWSHSEELRSIAFWLQGIANSVLILGGVWMVTSGARQARYASMVAGSTILIALAILRYFFLYHGYMATAAVFIVEAVILLALGTKLKRSREVQVAGRMA